MTEAVLNAYNQLDEQSQQSVAEYIFSLAGKTKVGGTEDSNHRYAAFLALAGKIDIDEDAVKELREISKL